jgi:hypothetical protein
LPSHAVKESTEELIQIGKFPRSAQINQKCHQRQKKGYGRQDKTQDPILLPVFSADSCPFLMARCLRDLLLTDDREIFSPEVIAPFF